MAKFVLNMDGLHSQVYQKIWARWHWSRENEINVRETLEGSAKG